LENDWKRGSLLNYSGERQENGRRGGRERGVMAVWYLSAKI